MVSWNEKITIGVFDVTKQVKAKLLKQYIEKHRRTIWMNQIRDSKYFLVLATPDYFDHVMSIVQSEFAKSLKKPFRILLKKGTEIPEGFFDGVDDLKIAEYDPEEKKSIYVAFKKVVGKDFDHYKHRGIRFVGEGF